MFALVKKPHIEISVNGENVAELVDWIRKKYDVVVLSEEPEEEFVPIEGTQYWQEMEKNRIGNLFAGARLKAGLTQTQLAEKLGIRQNMVSDVEFADCPHTALFTTERPRSACQDFLE